MIIISRAVSGHRPEKDGVGAPVGGDVFLFCGTVDVPVGVAPVGVGVGVAEDIRELGTGVGVADAVDIEATEGAVDAAWVAEGMTTIPESISRLRSSAAL